MHTCTLGNFFTVALLATLTSRSFAGSYSVTDLGPGVANAVNSSGHVVGTTPDLRGFKFDGVNTREVQPSGGPLPGLTAATVLGINDQDALVGITGGLYTLFYSDSSLSLGLGNSEFNFPVDLGAGLNNQNVVVSRVITLPWGYQNPLSVTPHDPSSYKVYDLPGRLNAINDSGIAAGALAAGYVGGVPPGPSNHPAELPFRAAILSNGVATYLDPRTALPAVNFGRNVISEAFAINAAGETVGSSLDGTTLVAFRATVGTGLVTLDGLGGPAEARAINASGVAVGWARTPDGLSRAVLWNGTKLTDLNTLLPAGSGWNLTRANGINQRGDIVGTGELNGGPRAFLLSPTDVAPPPNIRVHPQGKELALGETYTLSVTVQGGEPFHFQWLHEGTNLPAANGPTFTITSATAFNSGAYRVAITNATGNALSNPAQIDVLDPKLTPRTLLSLTIDGAVGATYRIDYRETANAPAWTPLTTLTLTSPSQVFVDYESANHHLRLYRAVRLP